MVIVSKAILRHRQERVELKVIHHDGQYRLMVFGKKLGLLESMPISDMQIERTASDILQYMKLEEHLQDFMPTNDQIIEAFLKRYTLSGKITIIEKLFTAEPSLKESIRRLIADEPLV